MGGFRGAPNAGWNSIQVFGASDLANHFFTIYLGKVQVYQDQIGAWAIRVRPLLSNEGQGFASVTQVRQLKVKVLPV